MTAVRQISYVKAENTNVIGNNVVLTGFLTKSVCMVSSDVKINFNHIFGVLDRCNEAVYFSGENLKSKGLSFNVT